MSTNTALGTNTTISGSSYWTPQRIADTFLFYGEISKISSGKLYNQVRGSSDYLTVGGSAGSYTFQAPNNATYQTADTDYIWFKTDASQRTTTEAELISYDLQRTPVKYDDFSPNAIRVIAILKTGVTLIGDLRNRVFALLDLPIMWDDSWNDFGSAKENRGFEQVLWLGDLPNIPTGLTLSLVAGGVKIDWTDNTGGTAETEIWGQSNGEAYALLYTIAAGTVTKNDLLNAEDMRYYKIRAKDGTLFSDYTAESSIAMLGAELITNGTFEVDANWTKGVNWSINTTNKNAVGATTSDAFFQARSYVLNDTYRLRFTLVLNGGTLQSWINITGAAENHTTSGVKTKYHKMVVTDYGYLTFNGGGFIGTLDNVSLKKVLVP